MKKIIEKINSNKTLFSITIIVLFLLFMLITSGFNGLFEKWPGVLTYIELIFDNLYRYTYYGEPALGELFEILLLIPVLLIFKNKYIFTQKKEGFFKSLLKTWPLLIFIVISLIQSIKSVSTAINPMEVLALVLLTFAIGVSEELACRGWLLNEFIERFGDTRKNVIFSILMSSFVFGIIHIFNFFGGQPLVSTLAQIIGAMLMGIALGAIYYRTKNIWTVVFIHGFWDFAVLFAQINDGTACITNTIDTIENTSANLAIFTFIFVLFLILLQEIPAIGNALLLLGKDEINDGLSKEKQEKLTEEDKKSSKKFRKVIIVVLIIYLVLWAFIAIFVTKKNENNVCPAYINKEVKEYSEKIIYNTEYQIVAENKVNTTDCITDNDLSKNSNEISNNSENLNCISEKTERYYYNFKINDDNKVVINSDNSNVILDYNDVVSLVVYENTNFYTILISAYNDSGDIVIYNSNYMTKNNIRNDINYLNELKNSFKQILLPNIYQLGYFEESGNDYKYPLFISVLEDRYILDQNGTIFKYNVYSNIMKIIKNK